jgi:hypothetical protein
LAKIGQEKVLFFIRKILAEAKRLVSTTETSLHHAAPGTSMAKATRLI